jgi:hypothetical protein
MRRLTLVEEERALWRLQCMLPVSAHGRPKLLKFLRSRLALGGTSPRLTVTNILYARHGKDIMCRFHVDGPARTSPSFVAPLEHLAFDRGHPIANALAAYSKGCDKRSPVSLSQDNAP